MSRPARLRLALFSDQHFGPAAYFDGKLRKLSHHAGALTRALVARWNAEIRPDLVVNLGDVLEDADPACDRRTYGELLAALRDLEAPVLHVAGNHDTVHLSAAELRALWAGSAVPPLAPEPTRPLAGSAPLGEEGPALHYVTRLGGWRIVVLHSVETKDVGVQLPEGQLAWLEAELGGAPEPTVVLVHHPASDQVLSGNRWFEAAPHLCRIANRKALRRVIARSGVVRAVFNGHAHWNHLDVCDGIPYVTLQSLTENLDEDAPGRPAAAWALATLEERRVVVEVFGAEVCRYQVEG